jgi:cytochrome c553
MSIERQRPAQRGGGSMKSVSVTFLVAATVLGGASVARAGGDKELDEYLANECVTCHQVSGKFDGIPSIVGWPEQNFIHALGEYRAKTRDNAVMRSIAVKFTDEEIEALAAYFGSVGQSQQTMNDATATHGVPGR